ncbi:MAG TPA: ABC transporter ATP-binding protein [Cellvibrionaceae bacterium]
MLKLINVNLSRGGKSLVNNLHWHIAPQEVWGLLGANGAGKSSLLLAMAGLLGQIHGQIHLHGRNIKDYPARDLARSIAYLAQEQQADFPIRVRDWAMLSRYPHQGLWGRTSAQDQIRVDHVLAQTQLSAYAARWMSELSGGERQRLALAGVLIQQAPWMLLDEPTNHLDIHYQMQLLPQLIAASRECGGALIMSLHDVNLAAQFCTHCLLILGEGVYLAGPVAEILTAEHISRLYKHPVAAWQSPNGLVFLPERS